MQAGGRRFDPVWLHQAAADCERLVREKLNQRALGFVEARLLSDIVKRRSIRALRVTERSRAARYSIRNQKSVIGNQKTSDYCRLIADA